VLAAVCHYWALACAWDHVDPARYHGSFTDENPYVPAYRRVLGEYEGMRQAATAPGPYLPPEEGG
jgi:hypothetical protein